MPSADPIPALPVPETKKKAPKGKKATAVQKKSNTSPSHPPYVEMINEAIVALKERTGSSQYAIAKFIDEKQKSQLPSNFKKHLLSQLKKLVASGKLVKVKNSFKIPAVVKQSSTDAKKPEAKKVPSKKKVDTKPKAAVAKPKAAAKPKSVGSGKPKGTPVKSKVVAKPKTVAKPKPKARPAKAAKTTTVTSPGKKPAPKVKKAPAKITKKPKRIKSPIKKAPAKK